MPIAIASSAEDDRDLHFMDEAAASTVASRDEAGRKPFTAVVVDVRGPDETESLIHARPTLNRWRRSGLAVAVVCTRRGAAVLPEQHPPPAVIDESRDPQPTLEGTVRLFGEATLRLDTAPADTMVVAHAVPSVAAAQALGFRRIVGVERGGDALGLLEAGARSVVDDLSGLRFPRSLPSGLDSLDEIAAWRAGRSLALFLDFDGTLTPIVADPGEAALAAEIRDVVASLAARFVVAVVSGRDRGDLTERVGIEGIYYAGSHGLDIAGPGTRFTPAGADASARKLRAAAREIERNVGELQGVFVERKRYSVAVHFRGLKGARTQPVVDAVTHAASEWGLGMRRGKQVLELLPDMPWHKGAALEWLRDFLKIDAAQTCLVYIGDDETDEDAFRALGPGGIGLRPGTRVAATLADYHLSDVDAVKRFLDWLSAQA